MGLRGAPASVVPVNVFPTSTRPLDPYELAERIGRQQWGEAGAIWMTGLEAGLLCRFLRRMHCDGNPMLRLRRSVGLIGGPSDGKTACLRQFVREISGCLPYGMHGDGPSYFLMDGDGVTKEGIRGGVTEGNLVMPILHDVDLLVSLEFQSWLESGSSWRAKVQWMNSILEEGHITIRPLSGGAVKASKRAEFAAQCAATKPPKRVHFDEERVIINYDAWASLFYASVPTDSIDEKMHKYMERSGFYSRSALSISDPSEEESNRRSENPFGPPDLVLIRKLRAFHDYAWKCGFSAVPPVPYDVVNAVLSHNMDTYRRISHETMVPISAFATNRDFPDAMQLIVAFAAMRRLWARMLSGKEPGNEGELDYTAEDIERAKVFRNRRLAQIERRVESLAKEDKVRDGAFADLVAFVRSRRPEESSGDERWLPADFTTLELVHHIVASRGVSRQTAYTHIAKLRKAGHLSATQSKFNTVGDRVLVELKVLPRSFRDRLDELAQEGRMESVPIDDHPAHGADDPYWQETIESTHGD